LRIFDMHFTGRSRELGRIRGLLDGRNPVLLRVTGPSGVGKSRLVRRAASDYAGIVHRCAPMPDPRQRAALSDRLRDRWVADGLTGSPPGADATWNELLEAVTHLAAAADRPFVFVLDDAHRLAEARARFAGPLTEALERARASATRLHVVLVGRSGSFPDFALDEEFLPPTLTVEPLPLRAAAPHLPGTRAYEVVRAYGVFGGIPRVLSALDSSVTVGTNVRRLLLSDAGCRIASPLEWLGQEIQTPSRYVAILDALSRGESDWSSIHAGVPDLTRSGQVAPYLNRLSDLGLVTARRSIDADARTRSTRYALTDPFVAFWFRFVFPWLYSDRVEDVRPYYARVVRPGINAHMETVLPQICRQHMSFDALETLGTTPREEGSLWGGGTDIPVAGTLRSGAAYYGVCRWATPAKSVSPPRPDTSPLIALDERIREARYGFGREHRLRLIFTGRPTPAWLRREVARRHDAHLIDAGALIGEA
jgi:uncharacterized protein